ncbi:MAG: hypothetical protein NVSMB19_15990 [Vulcanimicrobiaceae bacterium]
MRLGSVTVDNASNATIALYFDRPSTTGGPSTVIPTQFFKTIPINAAAVGIAIVPPKGDILRGLVYIEATTEKIAGAGGPSPNVQLGTMTWDYTSWDSGSTWAS